MNERIKELAEQAGLEFDEDLALESEPIYYITQKTLEKFAELIIRECSNIGEMKEQGYSQYDPDTSVGWYMRQHFGVKP